MNFDWHNPPFNGAAQVPLDEVEESFEDPFAVKLLPDSSRFAAQARFFNLGKSAAGRGIFSVYRTNGQQVRVVFARPFEAEETFFYERKVSQALSQ
ncbi:MAG: hypothetical protein ACKVYV_11355 [Limisphaerales bacterium]